MLNKKENANLNLADFDPRLWPYQLTKFDEQAIESDLFYLLANLHCI